MTGSVTHSDSFRITVRSLWGLEIGACSRRQDGKRFEVQDKLWQLGLLLPNDSHLLVGLTKGGPQPWLLIQILMPRPHLRPIQDFCWWGLGISIFKVLWVILVCSQD